MNSKEENINEDELFEKMFEDITYDEIENESLSFACEIEDFNLVKFLVEKGESVNYFCTYSKGWCGCSRESDCGSRQIPVLIAIYKNNIQITKYLIDNGARIDEQCINSFGDYCGGFRDWKDLKQIKYFEMLKLLVEKGCFLEDDTLEYFLKLKCKEKSLLLIEELIAKYHSPENIEKWSVYYNKPFDEVIEIM